MSKLLLKVKRGTKRPPPLEVDKHRDEHRLGVTASSQAASPTGSNTSTDIGQIASRIFDVAYILSSPISLQVCARLLKWIQTIPSECRHSCPPVCSDVLFAIEHNENMGFPDHHTSRIDTWHIYAYSARRMTEVMRRHAKRKLLMLDKVPPVVKQTFVLLIAQGSASFGIAQSSLSVAVLLEMNSLMTNVSEIMATSQFLSRDSGLKNLGQPSRRKSQRCSFTSRFALESSLQIMEDAQEQAAQVDRFEDSGQDAMGLSTK
ncbi:MAG: hypothetical protein J3Q66DRAFT_407553 [Benniella sp.]|nr:MAG: hypothetical protein J3Q66DRAFT_407553 [Benniella sp.]